MITSEKTRQKFTAVPPSPKMEKSPIGQLLKMGLTNAEMAEIAGVTNSAVSKWRTGRNGGTSYTQNRVRAYLDARKKHEESQAKQPGQAQGSFNYETPVPVTMPVTMPVPSPAFALETKNIFLVNVPKLRLTKFEQLMAMFGFDAINMDE
jgi:hypothetical protein